MVTVRLNEIARQKDPELKLVVEQLARGEVQEAVQNLDRQGRVHEIPDQGERVTAIAKAYADSPERTLVVSPDNRSRMEINERIHTELQSRGTVNSAEHQIHTLVPRRTSPAQTVPGPNGMKWAKCCAMRARRRKPASAKASTRG